MVGVGTTVLVPTLVFGGAEGLEPACVDCVDFVCTVLEPASVFGEGLELACAVCDGVTELASPPTL